MSRVFILYLGSLAFRSLCIAAIAGVCTFWVRNVAARHAAWVAVLIAMLTMPLADAMLPSSWVPGSVERMTAEHLQVFQVAVVESVSQPAVSHPSIAAAAPRQSRDWWAVAALLYAFVGVGLMLRLGLAYRKIAQLKRESLLVVSEFHGEIAAAHGLRWRIPQLRESGAVRVPVTIGFLRPVVILPLDWYSWDEWKLRAVLLHEFAHVRRADWAIAAVAAFNRCVFWMNPLSFFIERHLAELAEQASDDCVLLMTNDSVLYAEVLLQFAAVHSGQRILKGSVAMARHKMKARIERVLAVRRPETGILKLAGWTLVLSLAAPVLFTAAAIQVASSIAPAPAYTELVSQLPMPGLPRGTEQKSIVQTAAGQAENQIGVVFKTPSPLPALDVPPSNVFVTTMRLHYGSANIISSFTSSIQQPAEGTARLTSLPKVTARLNPIYPAAAWIAGIEGAVHLSLTIGADGHVSKVDVLSSPNPLLTPGAVDAMQQWVFESQQVDGRPASITREILVSFAQTSQAATNKASYSLSFPADNEIHVQMSSYPGKDAFTDSAEDLLNYIQLISSGKRPPSSPSTGNPFSFGLIASATGRYSLEIGERKSSYECHGSANCSFLVSSSGYAPYFVQGSTRSEFGVLVEHDLRVDHDPLTFNCQAMECTIHTFENGKTISRTLKRGEGVRVSGSSKISGTVH